MSQNLQDFEALIPEGVTTNTDRQGLNTLRSNIKYKHEVMWGIHYIACAQVP
jgi:hypothetical protein